MSRTYRRTSKWDSTKCPDGKQSWKCKCSWCTSKKRRDQKFPTIKEELEL